MRPIAHADDEGHLVQIIIPSNIASDPLKSIHPQFGSDLSSREVTILRTPLRMKNIARISVSVATPRTGKRRRMPLLPDREAPLLFWKETHLPSVPDKDGWL